MRIVLINWAKIWDGAPIGGGVNGYCQSLGLELAKRGHDVIYLCAGTQSTPDPAAQDIRPGPCMIRRHPDWLGIRVFEVVNSPILAPAGYQFRAPAAEVTAPALEVRIAEIMALLRPDVVHFHNIEGLTAGTVGAVRAGAPDARVLYTLHNYHTICPQVYLMNRYLFPCHDDHNGRDCETCIAAVDPDDERRRRAQEWATAVKFTPLTVASPTLVPQAQPSADEARPIRRALAALFKGEGRSNGRPTTSLSTAPPPAAPPVIPLPAYPADSAGAVSSPMAFPGADPRGQTAAILGDLSPARTLGPGDPEWEPLTNDIRPASPPQGEPNGYALRKRAMISMLNSCDRVLAVSNFVRAKFQSVGVNGSLLRTVPIGTRAGSVAARFSELLFDPPAFEANHPRPIRMVFMGYNNIYKGLPMLADTLELLTPEVLSRFHLYIYAQALQTIEWRFRRLEPRLGGLTVGHGYQYYDIPWLCGGKDLGLVPSVWWDNAPQTVFEFFACGLPVLAADIGGIPHFVQDGHNGILFRANDRYDLARRLAALARNPAGLADLRKNVRPPKDMAEHVCELEDHYAECLVLRESQRAPTVPRALAQADL